VKKCYNWSSIGEIFERVGSGPKVNERIGLTLESHGKKPELISVDPGRPELTSVDPGRTRTDIS
jgi:hypothetical protein